jgi:hypothetical protein
MLSDDELRAAAEKALRLGIECARDRKANILANLTGTAAPATTPKIPIQELPFTLTRAEASDYLDLAGYDPDKARELAIAECAVDFGHSLTSKHLQVLANLIDNAPEHDRATFALHTIDLLARWLLRKRQALGPDGRIVVGVKSWEKAKKIVAAWISDEFVRKKNSKRKLLPGETIYGVRPGSNQYVAWDGEQYVLRPTRDAVLADKSLMPIGSVRELRVDHPHPGRMAAVEVVIPAPQGHKAEPQSTSVRRRQVRPIDARKELIARLKARHPNTQARKICELIDRSISSTPICRDVLAALKSWRTRAPGKHSWVELYDDPRTRNRVRAYVNKVPTLQTATKSSR